MSKEPKKFTGTVHGEMQDPPVPPAVEPVAVAGAPEPVAVEPNKPSDSEVDRAMATALAKPGPAGDDLDKAAARAGETVGAHLDPRSPVKLDGVTEAHLRRQATWTEDSKEMFEEPDIHRKKREKLIADLDAIDASRPARDNLQALKDELLLLDRGRRDVEETMRGLDATLTQIAERRRAIDTQISEIEHNSELAPAPGAPAPAPADNVAVP